jgi:hypothetical protein
MTNLREFAHEILYANDYYGKHSGSSVGEPNDRFKPFRWMGSKLSGPTERPQPSKVDTKPGSEADIGEGEIDTHNLLWMFDEFDEFAMVWRWRTSSE